jgi:iron complex transport system substrate-binding protein
LEKLNSVKCKKCGRQLFKGLVDEIEIKCPKCGYVQTINGKLKKG